MRPEIPKVSVAVLYGEDDQSAVDAVDSVLKQQTEFAVEIVIGVGNAITSSYPKLKELASKHSDRVRIVHAGEDVGPNHTFAAVLNECSGPFVAVLDCDSVWLAESKLSRQVDYLERNPSCAICCHDLQCVDEAGAMLPTVVRAPDDSTLSVADLLRMDSIAKISAVVRRNLINPPPDWLLVLSLNAVRDWLLLHTTCGDIGYINEIMATVLIRTGGRTAITDKLLHYRNLNLILRRLRRRLGAPYANQIAAQLSQNHLEVSHELEKQHRTEDADRHRRLCFLYRRWKSKLPLQTKISYAIRPCGGLHSVAARCFELAVACKRSPPFVAFLVTTLICQPGWLLKIGRSMIGRGRAGFMGEYRVLEYLFGVSRQQYARWIRAFDTLTDADRTAVLRRIESMQNRPTVSLLMTIYNPSEDTLKTAIESVRNQLYSDWQLCIVDDASDQSDVRRILGQYQKADRRIQCSFHNERKRFSAASNTALALASGEFVAILGHNDELAEHALYLVAEDLNRSPDSDIIYSDEDRRDRNGRRVEPFFKTDWNPDMMLSCDMIGHLAVIRRQLVLDAGSFRAGFEGNQDYDLALRCIEATSGDRIKHIPAVLYHQRHSPQSVVAGSESADTFCEAGARAIREHLSRHGLDADVEYQPTPGSPQYRVRYRLDNPPLVSVIVPTKDQATLLRRCVDGLLNGTDYPHMEIIIINNNSVQPETHTCFESLRAHTDVRILDYNSAFNYSAINNFAVESANGDVICLLNNDTEVVEADWLREMVSHAVRDQIGAVGAKLLYPDNTIQHAGVLVGTGGATGHAFAGLPADTPVAFGRLNLIQNVSCVTAACMVLRKSVYSAMDGFDEQQFPVGYSDVDLCLRMISAGYRIVWTPHARLYHHESASLGKTVTSQERDRRERDTLRRRWSGQIAADPNMNPNVSTSHVDYRPAFPPRTRKQWY